MVDHISLELTSGDKIYIKNASDSMSLRQWLKEEKGFWGEIFSQIGHNNNFLSAQNKYNIIFSQLNEIIEQPYDSKEGLLRNFKSVLEHEYVHHKQIIYSKTRQAHIIKEIKEDLGSISAAAAVCAALKLKCDLENYDHLNGVIAYLNAMSGISNKTPSASKRSLEALIKKYYETIETADKDFDRVSKELERLTSVMKKRKKTLTSLAKKEGGKFSKKADEDIKEAIDSIKNTEQVYSEFMRLRAPAKYWNEKSKEHLNKSVKYKNWLIGFSCFGVIVLLIAVIVIGWLVGDEKIYFGNATVYSLIFILLTTAIIWPIRILIRLYLSEHHLSIDSAQRETMTMTYLAMIEENAASADQRQTIIEALFRPTADGLVKDDAAPQWLVAKHFTN